MLNERLVHSFAFLLFTFLVFFWLLNSLLESEVRNGVKIMFVELVFAIGEHLFKNLFTLFLCHSATTSIIEAIPRNTDDIDNIT
ncbi:MAG: hypothetical protein MJZ96_01760 [Paludibacteraceae bacterium]|nr:hypothetical protein [Paludibacteraceae bacterium]